MSQILSRFAATVFLVLLAAFVSGFISWANAGLRTLDSPWWPLHFYLGLTAVLLVPAVHCLVIIYLLGTGRWVKEVAQAYGIPDDPLPKRTRELKRQTFPLAIVGVLLAVGTAFAGAMVRGGEWHWTVHLTLGTLTIVVNGWAFLVAYRTATVNAEVIVAVMREVDRIRAAHGLPSNAEALRQQEEQEAGGSHCEDARKIVKDFEGSRKSKRSADRTEP
jgi:hypothetical protein